MSETLSDWDFDEWDLHCGDLYDWRFLSSGFLEDLGVRLRERQQWDELLQGRIRDLSETPSEVLSETLSETLIEFSMSGIYTAPIFMTGDF